jgi:hypothetical protein
MRLAGLERAPVKCWRRAQTRGHARIALGADALFIYKPHARRCRARGRCHMRAHSHSAITCGSQVRGGVPMRLSAQLALAGALCALAAADPLPPEGTVCDPPVNGDPHLWLPQMPVPAGTEDPCALHGRLGINPTTGKAEYVVDAPGPFITQPLATEYAPARHQLGPVQHVLVQPGVAGRAGIGRHPILLR